VRRKLVLEGGTLSVSETEDQGRLVLEDLSGEWKMTHFDRDEPVAPDIDITLAFDGEKISGRSACNRYSGRVLAGDIPGALSVAGPLASTRMACPEDLMQAEHRYLHNFANLRAFSFLGGRLVLSWGDSAESGSLMFERASPAGPAD
jgi:heat shock protein HslJ